MFGAVVDTIELIVDERVVVDHADEDAEAVACCCHDHPSQAAVLVHVTIRAICLLDKLQRVVSNFTLVGATRSNSF